MGGACAPGPARWGPACLNVYIRERCNCAPCPAHGWMRCWECTQCSVARAHNGWRTCRETLRHTAADAGARPAVRAGGAAKAPAQPACRGARWAAVGESAAAAADGGASDDDELDTPLAQRRGRPRQWEAGSCARAGAQRAERCRSGTGPQQAKGPEEQGATAGATASATKDRRRNDGCNSRRNSRRNTRYGRARSEPSDAAARRNPKPCCLPAASPAGTRPAEGSTLVEAGRVNSSRQRSSCRTRPSAAPLGRRHPPKFGPATAAGGLGPWVSSGGTRSLGMRALAS